MKCWSQFGCWILVASTSWMSVAQGAPILHSRQDASFSSTKTNSSSSSTSISTSNYIVKLKSAATFSQDLQSATQYFNDPQDLVYNYSFATSFSAMMNEEILEKLKGNMSNSIEYIEKDQKMSISEITTQKNGTWGLSRLSHKEKVDGSDPEALEYAYEYDPRGGTGVDVYVIDTGIYTDHEEFQGRANAAPAFGYPNSDDGNGHGSHCAGTIGGMTYGISKNVTIYGVKVLDDDGSGSTSDIIAGIQYVVDQQGSTGRPTVISMSLGGGPSRALDDAIEQAVEAGIHVSVAAGNNGADACSVSPARAKSANTIAAMDINDEAATFSNYGDCVDIWAPGVDIVSVGTDSPSASKTLSGTSMSAPHIAGLISYLLAVEGDMTPAKMSERLQSLATSDAVANVKSGTNLLAYNGVENSEKVTIPTMPKTSNNATKPSTTKDEASDAITTPIASQSSPAPQQDPEASPSATPSSAPAATNTPITDNDETSSSLSPSEPAATPVASAGNTNITSSTEQVSTQKNSINIGSIQDATPDQLSQILKSIGLGSSSSGQLDDILDQLSQLVGSPLSSSTSSSPSLNDTQS